MSQEIARILSPEEKELQKKRSELAHQEVELAGHELDLATIRSELHIFEILYLQTVGVLYAELDELNARIAAYQASLTPDDKQTRQSAEEARMRAEESTRDANYAKSRPCKSDF